MSKIILLISHRAAALPVSAYGLVWNETISGKIGFGLISQPGPNTKKKKKTVLWLGVLGQMQNLGRPLMRKNLKNINKLRTKM